MSGNGFGSQPPMTSGAARPPGVPSVCPRHPDRESYVTCQRCGRPTCPECQRPAAVGIQCVDCVAEAARSFPQAKTIFGGRATDGRPLVTYTLIGICTAVFVAQMASPRVTQELVFAPFLGPSQPWRFLTAAFLHSTQLLPHILFNMFALWSLGSYLEPILGRARFVALYLVSGLGGQVGVLLLASPSFDGGWTTGVLGASGAIFGLFGALLILNRHLGRSSAGMYVVLAINAALGFLYSGISWQAHLGGFVTGIGCAALLVLCRRPGLNKLTWAALGVVVVVLVLVTVAKYLGVPPELLA